VVSALCAVRLRLPLPSPALGLRSNVGVSLGAEWLLGATDDRSVSPEQAESRAGSRTQCQGLRDESAAADPARGRSWARKKKGNSVLPPPSILRAQADPAFGVLGRIFRAVTGWFLLVGVARVGRP
jgi:hypothetical protein